MMRTATMLPVVFLAGLFALVAGGCLYNEIDLPPCAETVPCREPVSNPCPNITPGKWNSLGLENEDVTAIAVHPCNPGIIYAGTRRNFSDGVRGKLFKSTDCGASWDTAREGIRLDAETIVASLAINPKNACELYAGTGGFFGGDLYKSGDAGESWQLIEGKGLEDLGNNMNRLDSGVSSLAINPADPDHIYVGTAQLGDVLRSTDGGDTWETTNLIDTGLIHSLLIDPSAGRIVYAGLNRKGLHKTVDGGKRWNVITNKFLADTTSVVELAMDEQNKVLHVVTTYGDSGTLLAYNIPTDVWEELPVPVTNKSFYYSNLNISVYAGKGYKYFGVSGIHAMLDE